MPHVCYVKNAAEQPGETEGRLCLSHYLDHIRPHWVDWEKEGYMKGWGQLITRDA